MKASLTLGRRLFLSYFLAILLTSGVALAVIFLSARSLAKTQLQNRLQSIASLLATELDASLLSGIDSVDDQGNPTYVDTLRRLRDWRRSNSDLEFLYVMRFDNGRIFFVVDSDESDEQALPGQEYEVAPIELLNGFRELSVDKAITSDEWGDFMSAYAPLSNGNGRYLIGVDMRANEVRRKFQGIYLAGGVSIGLAIVLAYLMSHFMARGIRKPIEDIVEQCKAIASSKLPKRVEAQASEMGDLVNAINSMSHELTELRDKRREVDSQP